MNKNILRFAMAFICALMTSAYAFDKNALTEADELEISADEMHHDINNGNFVASGNVNIRYGIISLTADAASINRDNMDFSASGNVTVSLDDGSKWNCPAVSGNLDKRLLKFGPYRLDSPIWHSAGEGGESSEPGNIVLDRVWISTCDLHEPHYRLSASTAKYSEDHTFSAKHVVLRFWNVPVFYFPYLVGNTDGTSGFIIRPGYSGKKGAYLRLGRAWRYATDGHANLYVDFMSKRGIGIGSETDFSNGRRVFNTVLYGLHDQDPTETEPGYDRRFKRQDDRFRINAYYRENLEDRLTLRANLDYLSDVSMLEDWFKHEYRRIQQPRTFVDVSYMIGAFDAGITIRPRVNDFYTVVETLPELRANVRRTKLLDEFVQYESMTKMGYYSMKWREFDRNRARMIPLFYDETKNDPNNYESWRLHSQHFLYLPVSLAENLKLTPRAGMAVTYYDRSSRRRITKEQLADVLEADNPDNPYSLASVYSYDAQGGDVTRVAFETGAELNTSFYGDWLDVKNDLFDINGLQHVIEPYVNYTYAPEPSHDNTHLYYFDDIDRLERQHFIRLGLDQRLLTKREDVRKSVIRLQSYVDFHFDRGEESGRHPGDLGNRLDFEPTDGIRYWAALVHDIGEGRIHRGETGLRLGKEDELNFAMRYIYRDEHISRSVWSMGSTLADFAGESSYLKKRFESADVIVADLYVPINSITALAVSAEYDFEKNKLSEHKYELHRQLHCWNMVFGIGWDNDDFEMELMFQLVAFPKIKMDLSM